MMRIRALMVTAAALCGAAPPASALLGGTGVHEGDTLAALSVLIVSPQGYCSGALIAPTKVLTAAHCVTAERLAAMSHATGRKGKLIAVSGVAVNPGYNPSEWKARRVTVDLAVLTLAEPMPLAPVAIDSGPIPQNGETLTLTGFGPDAPNGQTMAGVLRKIDLPVTGQPGRLQVRLAGTGSGGCEGDSGGPALRGTGPYRLTGVVSWTLGDRKNQCGVMTGLTPVQPHRDWIVQQAGGAR